ncbi:MAG: hypothetical protein Q8S01_06430, partial [Ignavibacteria bacterium]|nr:hypothetical protein [Ignavibacteria bacterium]
MTESLSIGHLINFFEYLSSRGIKLEEVADNVLEEFRDWQLPQVLARPNSIGSERAAKSTVNKKLMSVYQWLLWLQETERLPVGTIGMYRCSVSVLPVGSGRRPSSEVRFPLLYRKTGTGSKHRLGLAPTRLQLERASEQIMNRHDEYAALRDCLALDIAAETGMRRVSINSLTV